MAQTFTGEVLKRAYDICGSKKNHEPTRAMFMCNHVSHMAHCQEMGWVCEETISDKHKNGDYVSSIKLIIADTNYYLQVLPSIR